VILTFAAVPIQFLRFAVVQVLEAFLEFVEVFWLALLAGGVDVVGLAKGDADFTLIVQQKPARGALHALVTRRLRVAVGHHNSALFSPLNPRESALAVVIGRIQFVDWHCLRLTLTFYQTLLQAAVHTPAFKVLRPASLYFFYALLVYTHIS